MRVLELSSDKQTSGQRDYVRGLRKQQIREAARYLTKLRDEAELQQEDLLWLADQGRTADHVTVAVLHHRLVVRLGLAMYPFETFEKMMNGSDAMPAWVFHWVERVLGVPTAQLHTRSAADWYLAELAVLDETAHQYRTQLRGALNAVISWLDLWRRAERQRPEATADIASSFVTAVRREIQQQVGALRSSKNGGSNTSTRT